MRKVDIIRRLSEDKSFFTFFPSLKMEMTALGEGRFLHVQLLLVSINSFTNLVKWLVNCLDRLGHRNSTQFQLDLT